MMNDYCGSRLATLKATLEQVQTQFLNHHQALEVLRDQRSRLEGAIMELQEWQARPISPTPDPDSAA